jgi:hypothetical protein
MVNSKEMKMSRFFVLMREDKSLLRSNNFRCEFKQRAAAQRLADKLVAQGWGKIVVVDYSDYHMAGYDKLTRKVRNLMNGAEVEESINTPYSCSVASESYWCN